MSSTLVPGKLVTSLSTESQLYSSTTASNLFFGCFISSCFSLNPVVSFPFNRGPYPRYEQGVDLDVAIDDSADARASAKDFLAFIGAFTEEELDEYDVTFTEGAESGMTHIWAGKVCLRLQRATQARAHLYYILFP